MARKSPDQVAQKWAQKMGAASADYKAGVMAVQTPPGVRAAQQANVAAANYQEAISSGRWAKNVAAVSLTDWQQAAGDKGAGRLASGAQAAQGKFQSRMAALLPGIYQVADQVRQMPKGTLEENIARATAQMRGVSKLKGTR